MHEEEKEYMNELALFAGAGGGILGSKLLGWKTVCAVERDAHGASVLVQRQNDGCLEPFPIWSDVETFDGKPWKGYVDVVSGGFPCQDISCAKTSGKGLDGEKSSLFFHLARIVREVQPRYAFVENSPMLLVRGFDRVLGELAEMGYHARWGVFGGSSTSEFGLLRKRIWIVGFRYKIDVERLQISGRINTESRFRFYPVSATLPNVDASWLVANGYAMREIDDVARTMDRVERIGNGQIPRVVQTAWEILNAN
jgi:DNA (cytosine-5)-methyltransferase 1